MKETNDLYAAGSIYAIEEDVAGGAREMKGEDSRPDVIAWLAALGISCKQHQRAPGEIRVMRGRGSGGEADLAADVGDDLVGGARHAPTCIQLCDASVESLA